MFKDWKRRIKKVGLSDLYNLMFQMLSLQSAGMVSDMLVFFFPERHHNILLLVASVQAESMEFQQFEVNLCMAHGTRRSGTIFLATKPDTFI